MAPVNPNNTARVWLTYQTGGGGAAQQHELLMRYNSGSGTTSTQALQLIGLALVAIGPANFFLDWQAVSARAAAQGSDISLPVALPGPLTTFVGTGTAEAPVSVQARETKFVGRSPSTGVRWSLSLYGLVDSLFSDNDFRVNRIESNWVDDFLGVFEDTVAQAPVAIDNAVPNFYPYANWQFNSYWESRLRS